MITSRPVPLQLKFCDASKGRLKVQSGEKQAQVLCIEYEELPKRSPFFTLKSVQAQAFLMNTYKHIVSIIWGEKPRFLTSYVFARA